MKQRKAFNFTKAAIAALAPPAQGMASYRDTKEDGLSVYITAKGVVTFFVRKRVAGRDERIKIGRFPEVTIEQARKRARVLKGEIAAGQDPTAKNKQLRQELTFGQLFELYMERYSRPRKRSWRSDEREVKQYLAHWLSRRLSTITRNDVAVLHERMGWSGLTQYKSK